MKYTGDETLGLGSASVNTGINISEAYKTPCPGAEMTNLSVCVGYADPIVKSTREKIRIKELIFF